MGAAALVRPIDLRNVIGTLQHVEGPDRLFWFDEIHPSAFGVEKILPKFAEKIDAIWGR